VNIVKDKKSRESVFVFLLFSALIKHGDFHAKNIGLIEAGENRWELAPLYDIISTYAYEGKKSDDFGIGFDYNNPKKRKLRYKEYLQMSKVLKITTPRANSLIKDTIKRFQVYFPKYIEKTKEFEVSLGYAPFLSKKLSSLYIRLLTKLFGVGDFSPE